MNTQESEHSTQHNAGDPWGSDRPITLSLIILVILLGVILLVGWILARSGIDERPAPTPNQAENTQEQQNELNAGFYQNAQSQIQTPTSNPFEEEYQGLFE